MTHEQQQVKQWMTKFEQETPDRPTIPSESVRRLRAELILEEALETIGALGFELANTSGSMVWTDQLKPHGFPVTLVGIADGLGDSKVVVDGTGVACGLDLEPIFVEIMRSNESKMWTTVEVRDVTGPKIEIGPDWEEVVDTRKQHVMKRAGKVIKSPSYSPANLQPIIEAQQAK